MEGEAMKNKFAPYPREKNKHFQPIVNRKHQYPKTDEKANKQNS